MRDSRPDPDGQHQTDNPCSPWARSLLAGAQAGLVVDISLYPLDTAKTRLQTQFLRDAGQVRHLPRYSMMGTVRSMYAGLPSALVGSMPSAACFFVIYDGVKRALTPVRRHDHDVDGATLSSSSLQVQSSAGSAVVLMLASSLGEIGACVIRIPTEVVKQRAQAGLFNGSSLSTFLDILRLRHQPSGYRLVATELYRGGAITIAREIPFTILQFGMWEYFKSAYSNRKKRQAGMVSDRELNGVSETTALESALFGSIAGGLAAAATTPLDVLKTKRMVARKEEQGTTAVARGSSFDVLARIRREEGWKGLFRGVGPRVAWISLGGAIFLGTYQSAWNLLSKRQEVSEDLIDGDKV